MLRGPRLDPELLLEDFRLRLQNLDQTVRDLAGGDGAPPGFDPDRFLAPGVPRVRPLLVLLSARAAGSPARGDDPTGGAAAVELVHLAILVHDAALGRRNGLRRRAARRLLGGAGGAPGGEPPAPPPPPPAPPRARARPARAGARGDRRPPRHPS